MSRGGKAPFATSFGLLVTRETPCGQPLSPSHAHALMVLLDRAHARTSQAELGAALGIDKSNVARLCVRLQAAGHATQERAPHDGRGRTLKLTPRGARLARRVDAASRQRFGRIVAAMPAEARHHVLAALEVLNTAVESLKDEVAA